MSEIDRILPTRRPAGPPQGYQKWRTLLFVHWEVPAEVLRPLIPESLSIDTFDGKAYVGLVPFTMQGVRPHRALPALPFVSAFHETNVRTYVHHRGENPGVWFFSLEAASSMAVRAARTFFHLPYFRATMQMQVTGREVAYRSERRWPEPVPATLDLAYAVGDELPASVPGTLQFFLAERYFLYAQRPKDGAMFRGQVNHKPYPLRRATVSRLDESILAAAKLPTGGARTADLYSEGVDVELFALSRVE